MANILSAYCPCASQTKPQEAASRANLGLGISEDVFLLQPLVSLETKLKIRWGSPREVQVPAQYNYLCGALFILGADVGVGRPSQGSDVSRFVCPGNGVIWL
jgi:hypothetical protein